MSRLEAHTGIEDVDRVAILINEAKFYQYAQLINDPLLQLYTNARFEMFARNPNLFKFPIEGLSLAIKTGHEQALSIKPSENKSFSNLFKDAFIINQDPEKFAIQLIFLAFLTSDLIKDNLVKNAYEFISFCLVTADQVMKVSDFCQEKMNAVYDQGKLVHTTFLKPPGFDESRLVKADIPKINLYLEKVFGQRPRSSKF